jgi:hypothetical protein
MSISLKAGASRFAHLAGLSRSAKRAEDEDDRTDARRAEEDDDKHDDDEPKGKKSKRADEETPDNGDTGDTDSGGMKKSKRADDGDDRDDDDEPKGKKSKRASEDDDDDDEPKGKSSRRAEEDDDDDDEKHEMSGRSAAASARRRERARCAAIFASKAAAANPALAASLAFETTMTRKEALAVMRSQPAPMRAVGREAYNPRLGPGGDIETGSKSVANSWDAAFKKVRPRAAR